LSAGRQAYHHGNRLGWLGYGQKPRADIVGPKDGRAFRNIKLSEIPAWLNGRPKDIIYMYYSIRRYWIAWLYKYSRPGMKPLEAQTVGQYGYPGNFNLSGSGIAQAIFGTALLFQLVICKDENNHHRFKKYHDYPITETLMAYLPFSYKAEDSGAGPIALKSVATDFLFGAAIYQGITASQNVAPGMQAKRAQSGFALLALIGAVLFYNKVTFKGKGADFVSDADRAELATLLNCDASEVDALVKKNDQMNNSLRYSIFTNFIVRVYDATVGLVA